MGTQLKEMGGELQVSSRPGEGTVLEARIPLLTEQPAPGFTRVCTGMKVRGWLPSP